MACCYDGGGCSSQCSDACQVSDDSNDAVDGGMSRSSGGQMDKRLSGPDA